MKLMKIKENKKKLRKKNKKKNEVEDDKGKNKEADEEEEEKKNEVEDDGIKIVNSHTFHVHLQPNATGDSIMRKSCFGHFLDLPEKNNARFQMTMVYELLKRRFIFQNPEKKDDVLINYCGMSLFFGRREFAIVSGLKCHPPSEPIPEFIAWPFEAIPHLTHQVTAEEEISSPRILRWLRAKNVENPPDLFNPPHDAAYVATDGSSVAADAPYVATDASSVVYLWIVPTKKELQMPYLITLGLVETLFDPVVDRVKMELAGARTIKRDKVDNLLVIFDEVDVGGGIDAGVDVGGGIDAGVDVGAGQDQRATSCRRCSDFLCEKCKKQEGV
ncbi:hypothetical protein KY290_031413 [Solanum tuberosum]|uniref:DUF1985 domain-containing protein n=1 Tax=Solanum tuberosum TaxID=4113 RepID=A0ABQ7UCK0_SOLTU|nr:hypothetical protein KY289_030804 [Solanum tuberosum]KAH0743420.1 hypothetical protein KY290_031413 [Solanum tuberosum]